MPDALGLKVVCLDTGIYVAGLIRRLPPGRHLGAMVLAAARLRAFRPLMLDSVAQELLTVAEREGVRSAVESDLLEFLVECNADWPRSVRPAASTGAHLVLAGLRHVNDLAIAQEVQHHRPDFFIHGNPEHWSGALDDLLGTRVVTSREFLLIHGITPPPRTR